MGRRVGKPLRRVRGPSFPFPRRSACDRYHEEASLASSFETGTPFVFYRDTVNRPIRTNIKASIYCSNLCTEICQNMSAAEYSHDHARGRHHHDASQSGRLRRLQPLFASTLAATLPKKKLKRSVSRPNAHDGQRHRLEPLSDRASGNHEPEIPRGRTRHQRLPSMAGAHTASLGNPKSIWTAADELYEWINYCAIKAIMEIAKEKGAFRVFEGSEWQTGEYFEPTRVTKPLMAEAAEGRRRERRTQRLDVRHRAYGFHFPDQPARRQASTRSSAKFFVEEKKNAVIPQTAPNLNGNVLVL